MYIIHPLFFFETISCLCLNMKPLLFEDKIPKLFFLSIHQNSDCFSSQLSIATGLVWTIIQHSVLTTFPELCALIQSAANSQQHVVQQVPQSLKCLRWQSLI